jgi:hypothetical protein
MNKQPKLVNYFIAFLLAMTVLRVAGQDVKLWTDIVVVVLGTAWLFVWVVGRIWGQEDESND